MLLHRQRPWSVRRQTLTASVTARYKTLLLPQQRVPSLQLLPRVPTLSASATVAQPVTTCVPGCAPVVLAGSVGTRGSVSPTSATNTPTQAQRAPYRAPLSPPPRAHLAELAADLLWQVLPQAAEHGHLEGRDRVHDLLEPNRELPHPAGSNPASTHSAWKRAWLQPGSARPSGLGASPPMRMRFTTLASVAEPSGAVRSLQFFHWTSQQNSMRTRKRDQHMLAAPASHRSRLRTAVPAQAAALQTRALDQASQTPHVKSMGQAGAPECPGVPLSLTLAPHSSLWCTLGYFSPRDARRSGQ